MTIEKRVEHEGAVILIADGFISGTKTSPFPHYRTAWAVGTGEDLKIMNIVAHEFLKDKGFENKKDERIDEAVQTAKDFIWRSKSVKG